MDFTDDKLKFLRNEGYLVIHNYKNQATTLALFDAIKYVVLQESQAYNTPEFYASHGAVNHTFDNPHLVNATLDKFSVDLNYIAQRMMPDAYFHMSLIQHNKCALSHSIPWHQDISYKVGAGKFYNFLFYPQTSNEAMGGLRLVPKSHLSGKLGLGGSHDALNGEIVLYPKAGDLVVVDGLTFHAVPVNQSQQDRYSYCTRYIDKNLVGSKALDIGHYRTGSYDYAKKESITHV
ncbi:phytanoyl-CoA dioxygenase family protein [Pseudomonas sp. HK3]|jgi:hypothetical protein